MNDCVQLISIQLDASKRNPPSQFNATLPQNYNNNNNNEPWSLNENSNRAWLPHGFSDMNMGGSNKSSGLAVLELLRADPRCSGEGGGLDVEKCVEAEQDMAATIQAVFEDLVLERIAGAFEQLTAQQIGVQGLAVAGGGALNVLLNAKARRRFGLPVYVPSAPGDGGLAVGFAWMHSPPPPTRAQQNLAYLGLRLVDIDWDDGGEKEVGARPRPRPEAVSSSPSPSPSVTTTTTSTTTESKPHTLPRLEEVAADWRAVRVDVGEVAALLAAGNIIGVVRGRSEFGPRALGHRSLLAVPSKGMKTRMNTIKAREHWRPVAPMILAEDVDKVFAEPVDSPYMSFAARLRPEMIETAPAIWHFDGTARPQTVRREEPWLHALLTEVKALTGLGILCNTSFNTKGQPMVNTAKEALAFLESSDDLASVDNVLI